jgi:2-dehydro-3-deoxygalactonokinase
MNEIKNFLSCDWGTSSFRLKLVEIAGLEIIAEISTTNGIARTYELWKAMNEPEDNRFVFYARFLDHHIQKISQQLDRSLDDIPIIVSGMASSNIGMIELPYKKIPFRLDGSDLLMHARNATDEFRHDALIISGVSTDYDVMRGEETQITGCEDIPTIDWIYILPGTHSKHVMIKNGIVADFKTFMTGEFFELLSTKSILSGSVEEGADLMAKNNLDAFEDGIKTGIESNLLNSSFLARTNILLNKLSKQENYYWLSGLLIGSEMSELIDLKEGGITIIGDPKQLLLYNEALKILRRTKKMPISVLQDSNKATIRGQVRAMLNQSAK